MNNQNVPDGMISVEKFSQQKGITNEKAISMIRDGFYSGRIVGEQWYVNTNELDANKINSPKINTYLNNSNYSTGRAVASFISGCGWFIVFVGVILTLVLSNSTYNFNFLAILPGISMAIVGLFMVATGQVTKATVDNADHTREIMLYLKERN